MADETHSKSATTLIPHLPVRVPMRDGILLSGLLYRPPGLEAPRPAILTMTPYIAAKGSRQASAYAARGYPVVHLDVRGCGDSEGEFRPGRDVEKDGYDAVEWLARQGYCDGRVLMCGASYPGWAQWAVAAEAPPHLESIIPTAAALMGLDFPVRNHLISAYSLFWLMLTSGRATSSPAFHSPELWKSWLAEHYRQGLPFAALDAHFHFPSPVFQEWIAHADDAEYWAGYAPRVEDYGRIDIPVLTITGSHDADQPGALAHYRRHLALKGEAAEHYLVIGPWDHGGTAEPKLEFQGLRVGESSRLDMIDLHADWFAWTAGEGPRPAFLKDKVAYYVMGADRWRYAPSLEAVTGRHLPMHLSSDGSASDIFHSGCLHPDACAGDPDGFVHDPADWEQFCLEDEAPRHDHGDQRLDFALAGRQLVYHSEPFAKAVEIAGFFALEAWLSIDQPDADFHATVSCVDDDGSAVKLTEDWIRARHRCGGAPALVRTTEPLLYRFRSFTFVSRELPQGSRLRLVIKSLNTPQFQRNYCRGGNVYEETLADARSVRITLFHDGSRKSILYIPIGTPPEHLKA